MGPVGAPALEFCARGVERADRLPRAEVLAQHGAIAPSIRGMLVPETPVELGPISNLIVLSQRTSQRIL